MNTILWSPSESQIKDTAMWQFMQYINGKEHLQIQNYSDLYNWSIEQKEKFWARIWSYFAVKHSQSYDEVISKTESLPGYQWFSGSRLNFAENLLCKAKEMGNKNAIIFHGEDKIRRELNYTELEKQVARLSNALRKIGVKSGDCVAGFLPNMPEAIIAMLATTSIGAIWSSCSPDFGLNGVLDRFGQIRPVLLFCADGYYFKGKAIDSLSVVDQITENIPSIKSTIVCPYITDVPRVDEKNNYQLYLDILENENNDQCVYEQVPFDHPVYILYSSGTTGKPKCIVHGVGGTLLQHLKELVLHTNLKSADKIFYFTTCGWMMWNWLVSGLATGATIILYDGSPTYPNYDSLIEYTEKENISIFGTSAKYISALEKSGVKPKNKYKLASLNTILSTGSPLTPESFDYVYREIKRDIQLSSISGGTDIVSCFALGNPILPVLRGELQSIGLGMEVRILNTDGDTVKNEKGELTCVPPFPSMPIYFWNDSDNCKYHSAYFNRHENIWTHGDYAELTASNGLVIYGRSDAILNPGGVRIGTAEIYRQVEKLPEIMESIAVGQQWENDIRILLFVVLAENKVLDTALVTKIKKTIKTNTTPRHVPDKILTVSEIPRTRSGKIVEVTVSNIVNNRHVDNLEALANPDSLIEFKNRKELES